MPLLEISCIFFDVLTANLWKAGLQQIIRIVKKLQNRPRKYMLYHIQGKNNLTWKIDVHKQLESKSHNNKENNHGTYWTPYLINILYLFRNSHILYLSISFIPLNLKLQQKSVNELYQNRNYFLYQTAIVPIKPIIYISGYTARHLLRMVAEWEILNHMLIDSNHLLLKKTKKIQLSHLFVIKYKTEYSCATCV